ncbi:hypothetical protein [Armatimonas rosea]|uniref:Uncharacterized protein n=1 Tax=Armatimonas rosea TaxID=685828 RepID=A0A7W9SP82_ARMRO|nr:hypothetical protein [Armatimonas rosea]MBB6049628.1 hypothetical protein [Armatimonas rosea]
MPRRKRPSPIYLAWEKIVFGEDKYSPKSQQAWAALWQQHAEGDVLAETAIADVERLASLGYDLAAKQGDWQVAKERIERYFQHPNWQNDEPIGQLNAQTYLSRALWECHEENSALQLWVRLIRQPGKDQKLACLLVLQQLLGICQSHPSTTPTRTLFSAVVREVFEKLTETKLPPVEIPKEGIWAGFTYGELAALLDRARTARTNTESH